MNINNSFLVTKEPSGFTFELNDNATIMNTWIVNIAEADFWIKIRTIWDFAKWVFGRK